MFLRIPPSAARSCIVFGGSKKSLATGIPMVNVPFPAASAGIVVLPPILFHQIHLMVRETLARCYLSRADRGTAAADTQGSAAALGTTTAKRSRSAARLAA